MVIGPKVMKKNKGNDMASILIKKDGVVLGAIKKWFTFMSILEIVERISRPTSIVTCEVSSMIANHFFL